MVLLLAMIVAIMTLRTLFLLVARKPVLAEVVQSSLSDWTRYGLRRWQSAKIGDALSAGDAPEPTEAAEIRVRYTVEGREYFKDFQTVVRKGERPEPTLTLWYDPNDPTQATNKGISWPGLAFGFVVLASLVTGLM